MFQRISNSCTSPPFFQLHEVAKLKSLKDLTSLFLADNPIVNLPHYRLYTIFHLRSLEDLEGQPVTNHDREEALERFNLGKYDNHRIIKQQF